MKKEFTDAGTFNAVNRAREWLHDRGYSEGSMCGDAPMGILKGDFLIAKWRNLTAKEKKELHGVITSRDFREGPVTVELYGVPDGR